MIHVDYLRGLCLIRGVRVWELKEMGEVGLELFFDHAPAFRIIMNALCFYYFINLNILYNSMQLQ
jgi:hypothetical protein